jgi:hypothetical protein
VISDYCINEMKPMIEDNYTILVLNNPGCLSTKPTAKTSRCPYGARSARIRPFPSAIVGFGGATQFRMLHNPPPNAQQSNLVFRRKESIPWPTILYSCTLVDIWLRLTFAASRCARVALTLTRVASTVASTLTKVVSTSTSLSVMLLVCFV